MPAEKIPGFCRLFKNCLYLGDDVSVIEKSLRELQSFDPTDLNNYLNTETQIAPLLLWHLKRRGLTSLLDHHFAAGLQYRHQENLARNFLFERRLEEILAVLGRDGLEVLVLKGASVFVKGLSVFRAAFVLSDIDLLVRPTEFERATEILISMGYRLKTEQAMDGESKRCFIGADNVTAIDLHSALFWTRVRFNYLDYFQSDLWKASMLDSINGYPVRILSIEDQICYRLAHDAIGHQTLLLSNTCRLYYLCLLIDSYRDSIDWAQLLEKLKGKGGDRLLAAYAHYGKRELGLHLPPALEQFHQGADDVAYLDAVVGSSQPMADYNYRVSVAALTTHSLQGRLKKVFQEMGVIVVSHREGRAAVSVGDIAWMFKVTFLQLLALLYVSIHGRRHSIFGG